MGGDVDRPAAPAACSAVAGGGRTGGRLEGYGGRLGG